MAGKAVATIDPEDEVLEGEVIEADEDDGMADLAPLKLDTLEFGANEDGTLEGSTSTMSKTAAKKFTTETKAAAAAVVSSVEDMIAQVDNVRDKIEQGYDGNVHINSGYASFGAWVIDVVGGQLSGLPADARKPLVKVMVKQGLSLSAIAKSLEVNVSTVSRDVRDEDQPEQVEGLDGKVQKKPGRPRKETAPEDDSGEDSEDEGAEVIELAPPKQLPPAFAVAVQQLSAAVDNIDRLAEDKRFAKSAKKFGATHGEAVLAAANSILDLCDKLGIEVYEAEDESEAVEADEDTEAEDEAEEFEEESDEDETDSETDEFEEDESEDSDDEDEPF